MKTESLIELLAQGAGPAPRRQVARRLLPVLGGGVLGSVLLALWIWGRVPDAMWATPAPWMKLAYTLAVATAAWVLVDRLARPGARAESGMRAVMGVTGAMAVLALGSVVFTAPEARRAEWMGHSWAGCPLNVALLSLPGLALALWALRGLAPTRPRAAGAAAGLLAGALGAAGYSLACTEPAASFVATWYTLGMAAVVALGAALGPRLLRW